MLIGKVIGSATATVKHESLEGWKLLVVQPLAADGKSPDGDPLLAVDPTTAGPGERVILNSDGRSTRDLIGHDTTPVRWSVMGICDE